MNGVLIRNGIGRYPIKNIGDFIQSIAQRQYWEGTYECLVEIEEMSEVRSDEPINVIMNGWFMHEPDKMPPSRDINPFYISFHLTPNIEEAFFTKETIAHLKAHEPIGARDLNTMRLMETHGVESYFSNCLTLTLNKTYPPTNHDGGVYFVEPDIDYGAVKGRGKNLRRLISLRNWVRHPLIMNKLYNRYKENTPPIRKERSQRKF